MTPEPGPLAYEYTLLPPKGWTDIGATRFFYRETKRGPKYLCRYCGEINEPRHPNYHKPGCPHGVQTTGENNENRDRPF